MKGKKNSFNSYFWITTININWQKEKDHAIVKWLIDDKISVIPLNNILLNDKDDEYKIEEVYH
jgi:hypothetical protein